MVPRSFMQGCRYALLAIAAMTSFGCTSLGGPWFTRTPPDPASRVYPSVATGCTCTVTPVATHWFERVVIIVLENQDYEDAIKNGYLKQLAEQGASFTNFHGLFHPSYSNYLAMVAGKDIPSVFDRQRDLNECTVADLLQSHGLTWKSYAQGYPAPITASANPEQCFKGSYSDKYARKHVPLMSFIPIQKHDCGNIVAANRFSDDIRNDARPNYAFYTPDLNQDGHDTNLSYAAEWLESFLEPLLTNQTFMKGTLIIVTFDESKNQSENAGNHIYTVFLGPMIQQRQVEDNYSHYNVLRTIEENFGLCALGEGDSGAKPITSVWKSAGN